MSENERIEGRRVKKEGKVKRREERKAMERAEGEEEDQGRRKQKVVEKARRREEKALENEAVAEKAQVELDERGVGKEKVKRRLEGVSQLGR